MHRAVVSEPKRFSANKWDVRVMKMGEYFFFPQFNAGNYIGSPQIYLRFITGVFALGGLAQGAQRGCTYFFSRLI